MLSNAVPNKHITNIYQISRCTVGKLHGASIAECVATQSQIEDQLLTGVNFGCLATVAKTDAMSARPHGNRQPIDRHRKAKAMAADQRFSHEEDAVEELQRSSSRPLHQL